MSRTPVEIGETIKGVYMDLKYDFNGDGKVNLRDVVVLSRVMQCYPNKISLADVQAMVDEMYKENE